jgi:predicted GH43/DUF377 family glycosyl hydrolase
MKLVAPLAAAILLAGCGQYADFTLPALRGGKAIDYNWRPQTAPVIGRGTDWDSHDALNPSVVRSDRFYNFYSGFDGKTWRTGLATSEDGLEWKKFGMVLGPDPQSWEGSYIAANGSALFYRGEFWYWYQAGARDRPRIGLSRSPNGKVWRKEPAAVLSLGPRGAWDERGVGDPFAIRIEQYFYLFYLGQDRARRQRLGVARSQDGIAWEKLRSNPLLELGDVGAFDENGLGEPAVWTSGGFYWMLYTGRDVQENRRLGMARSTDGIHWQKLPTVIAGLEAWDSKVICDPSVIADQSGIRVWFGGGDIARPDENLNGQIGYGVLQAVSATLAR